MECYIFQREGSKVSHAVLPKHKTMGTYELDRIFGGGLYIYCTGKKGYGKGILSESTRMNGLVTCKNCLAKMKRNNIKILPSTSIWPPTELREQKGPTCLGIPG